MKKTHLTCVECPIGCQIEVELDGESVLSVKGNSCPRGKTYAENEVVCPRRVITSTVRTKDGRMLPVKTDKPVKKSEIFEVMQKINGVVCELPVKIGDILMANVSEDIHLIATRNMQ